MKPYHTFSQPSIFHYVIIVLSFSRRDDVSSYSFLTINLAEGEDASAGAEEYAAKLLTSLVDEMPSMPSKGFDFSLINDWSNLSKILMK
jgi:hypothetical protein